MKVLCYKIKRQENGEEIRVKAALTDFDRIHNELVLENNSLFGTYKPYGPYQIATNQIRLQAISLSESIAILLEHWKVVEAAILFRGLMNLNWSFLWIIGASPPNNGVIKYEDGPEEGHPLLTRARRFLL